MLKIFFSDFLRLVQLWGSQLKCCLITASSIAEHISLYLLFLQIAISTLLLHNAPKIFWGEQHVFGFYSDFLCIFEKKLVHKLYVGLSCGHFGTLKWKIGPFLRPWLPLEGEFLRWFWGKKCHCAADDRVTRQHFNWLPHNCTRFRKSEKNILSIFFHRALSYIASKIPSCYLNTL